MKFMLQHLIKCDKEELQVYKEKGFSDRYLASVWNVSDEVRMRATKELGITAVYKTVDTCAAEFESHTNYHYSTYFGENEQKKTDKKKSIDDWQWPDPNWTRN